MKDILKNKVAIVYGAGPIGGAVAKAFAGEGAQVYIADWNEATGAALADAITTSGGKAVSKKVDALDKQSLDTFIDQVVKEAGHVDVSFNAINVTKGGEQGKRLVDLDYEDFALPITTYTKTQFLTANAVTPQMIKQNSGVIMMITAIPSRMPLAGTVGFGPAWAAIEALSRTLAVELGEHGIRTVCLHSTGSPETQESIQKTFTSDPAAAKKFMDDFQKRASSQRLIANSTSLENVGAMAAFMASDKASASTGTIANMAAGMVI